MSVTSHKAGSLILGAAAVFLMAASAPAEAQNLGLALSEGFRAVGGLHLAHQAGGGLGR